MTVQISVTGMGICSPIGSNINDFAAQLRTGDTGIRSHRNVLADRDVFAGIVDGDGDSGVGRNGLDRGQQKAYDRTAKMGIHAASQALSDAGLSPALLAEKLGLVLGTSHGGRSQLDRFVENGSRIEGPETSESLLETSAHFQQTGAVAACLSIHGPTVTLSNACSSSGAAIAYGIELLRSGTCDVVLAGGADGFSKLTLSGFASLGAVSDAPCAPFSEPIGLSLGDGAGFIVLERTADAVARDANIYAELWGYGLSWDAYHITAPEPSGEGMVRAMTMAVGQAGIDKTQIGYVNVHGTGTRSNDVAEAVGLRHFFGGDEAVPPLSATKSQTGHMLGASSVVGVITSILGMKQGWLPPTSNFTTPRSGCELDVVPNGAREQDYSCFMAQSAAFAGANAVIIGGKPQSRPEQPTGAAEGKSDRVELPEELGDVVISGMGVVSPLGFTLGDFYENLRSKTSGLSEVEDPALSDCGCRRAGLVRDYKPRKLMPTLKLRRVDRVASFATIASAFALQDSGLWPIAGDGSKIGLVVGVSRGAASSYEKYLGSVEGENWNKASAVHFPNLVMSSVGGQVSSMLGIRGITSSLVGGTAGGLQALVHAYELFRRNPTQQAVVVVASDEVASLFFRLFDQHGVLESEGNEGMVLGEGAVAFVLERRETVSARGGRAKARIAGYGMTNDAALPRGLDSSGEWLAKAVMRALEVSGIGPEEVDQVFANRVHLSDRDARTASGLRAALQGGGQEPKSINDLMGVAEAASGMFHAAAAVLGMEHETDESVVRSLICASGEDGSNVGVVLESEPTE